MKSLQLLLIALILFTVTYAQEVKHPLEAKVRNEVAPEHIVENHIWVKSHYKWEAGKYAWIDGYFLEAKEGYDWVDGDWERNVKTGWWKFNDGYWRKRGAGVDFKNKPELMAEKPIMDFDKMNTKPAEHVHQPTMGSGSQVNIESTQTEKKSIMIKTTK